MGFLDNIFGDDGVPEGMIEDEAGQLWSSRPKLTPEELERLKTARSPEEFGAIVDTMAAEKGYERTDPDANIIESVIDTAYGMPGSRSAQITRLLDAGVPTSSDGLRYGDLLIEPRENIDPTALDRIDPAPFQPPSQEERQSALLNMLENLPAEDVGSIEEVEKADVKSPKRLQSQFKAGGYGLRAQRASRLLSDIDEIVDTGTRGIALQQAEGGVLKDYLPSIPLLRPDQRSEVAMKKDQAERDFVNAILRRESGAVISESEFDNASKQYFARWGDSPEVLAQKRANRDLTSAAVLAEAAGFENDVQRQEVHEILRRDLAQMGAKYVAKTHKVVIPVEGGKFKVLNATDFVLEGIEQGLYRPRPYLEEELESVPRIKGKK